MTQHDGQSDVRLRPKRNRTRPEQTSTVEIRAPAGGTRCVLTTTWRPFEIAVISASSPTKAALGPTCDRQSGAQPQRRAMLRTGGGAATDAHGRALFLAEEMRTPPVHTPAPATAVAESMFVLQAAVFKAPPWEV